MSISLISATSGAKSGLFDNGSTEHYNRISLFKLPFKLVFSKRKGFTFTYYQNEKAAEDKERWYKIFEKKDANKINNLFLIQKLIFFRYSNFPFSIF